MKKFWVILAIVLLSIVCSIIYVYPKIGYSPVLTSWGVRSGWTQHNIIHNGVLPQNVHSMTWQSALANVGTTDVLSKVLPAMVNIITGTTSSPESELFQQIFPWVGIIFLPLIVLYFYRYISKKEGKFNGNGVDYILLYLFCVFPLEQQTFSMSFSLGAANSIARASMVLIFVLFITLFSDRSKSRNKFLIIVFLFIAFFEYYHTFSYYLVIFLVILFLASRKINERHMANLSICGIIIFFVTALFYNTNLLQEPTRLIGSFSQIISNFPSVTHSMQVNPNLLNYVSLGSSYSYVQYIASSLIAIICIIFFWRYITQKRITAPKLYEKILFYLLIAEIFIGCGLFVVNGIFTVYQRIFETLTYLSLLLTAFLLVKSQHRLKTVLRIIILATTILCIISFLIDPTQNQQITNKEFTGISFAGVHIPKTSYIFSDFKIGPTLVYFGQQGIVTINTASDPPNVTNEILERCYYNVSNPQVILDQIIDSKDYYVVISSGTIQDPSLQVFKPPSADFEEKWSEQNSFNIIYSSGGFDVYQRVAQP